jgi:hypothetical protein
LFGNTDERAANAVEAAMAGLLTEGELSRRHPVAIRWQSPRIGRPDGELSQRRLAELLSIFPLIGGEGVRLRIRYFNWLALILYFSNLP